MSEDVRELNMDELDQVVGGVTKILNIKPGKKAVVMSDVKLDNVIAHLYFGCPVDISPMDESHPFRNGTTEWVRITWFDQSSNQLRQGWIETKYLP